MTNLLAPFAALTFIVLVLPTAAADEPEIASASSCTTSIGSCSLDCVPGGSMTMGGFAPVGELVNGQMGCQTNHIRMLAFCVGVSLCQGAAIVPNAARSGFCELIAGSSASCQSSPLA